MPKGGARINSGPAPDPNALRRDRAEDKAGWTILPADGRQGDPPDWPLQPDVRIASQLELAERQREVLAAQVEADLAPRGSVAKVAKLDQVIAELKYRLERVTEAELLLWGQLWATPQAVAWQRLRYVREVALYARLAAQAELGDLDAGKEARQWSDRLGLNAAALLRLRWKIDGGPPASAPVTSPGRRARGRAASTKDRGLRLVQDEGGSSA